MSNKEHIELLLNTATKVNGFSPVFIDALNKLVDQVQKLEKERSKWKGKHSILNRKHSDLRWRHRGACRHVEVIGNDRDSKKKALETIRGENKQLHEAIQRAYFELSHEDKEHAVYRTIDVLDNVLKEDKR